MQPLFIMMICIIAISVIVMAMVRIRLKKQVNALSEKFSQISSYSEKSNYEQAKDRLSTLNEKEFIDIPTDLNNGFYGKIISATQEQDFINHYKSHFQEAYSLLKKLEAFKITPSENISKFINDFGAINKLVKQHNEGVITFLLDAHKDFFDHCLKYPLDMQQRRSIVSEEDNCLVVSSAGSGKTSSIVGKVKYLTEVKGIAPHKILLISYTNKAAAELTERMATNGLKGYTFHKLAIDIIGKTTGTKPSICDNTDSLFVDIYHKLLDKSSFKKSIVEYFIDYQTNEADWEQRKNERREQLSEQKNVQLKAMFPDMDGRAIYVRSEQEQKICFALSSLGVKFRYEEPYEHQLADEMHSQYRPDFSIYFNKSVDRHINLTNRLLRRFCRGLSNDLENVRNSLLCVSILSRDPFQIQRYEFSLNLQKYSVQVLYKTKARGYEPRTFFPFISCYHVGWFRRRVAIRLKGFSANYEK